MTFNYSSSCPFCYFYRWALTLWNCYFESGTILNRHHYHDVWYQQLQQPGFQINPVFVTKNVGTSCGQPESYGNGHAKTQLCCYDIVHSHLLSVVPYLCEQCCLQYCHKFVLMYLSAAVVNCYSPQSFPNGTFTLVNGSTTLNSAVKYECRMGLQLVGSTNRICQSNGQWSGQEPRCEGKFHL